MSKQITMSMWCSVIPDKIYNKWVNKKWIPRGASNFAGSDKNIKGHYGYFLQNGEIRKYTRKIGEVRRLKIQGFEEISKTWILSKSRYEKMREEVGKWYDSVFKHVTEWLTDNGFIKLKQGSFDGGFCVETDSERDVVKNWGAPLADEGNKVVQIKEKFGAIVVYFAGLTEKEAKKVAKFERSVQKKFDCETRFG